MTSPVMDSELRIAPCRPEDLEVLTRVLRERGTPFVFTVHDLRNPHHHDRSMHDEQLAVLLDRLVPHANNIAALAAALRTADGLVPGSRDAAQLSVARWFNIGDGEEEDDGLVTLDDARVIERAGGQHQLLGWCLDRRTLEFLHAVGAELNVDEYG